MDMKATRINNIEDHWVQWATYKNLKMWLENRGKDLVDFGFAHRNKHGEVVILDDQLHQIIIFIEMCLSHNGSNGARGGHPEVFLYDPWLPLPGKRTSECSTTTTMTMITGSMAVGEALTPHIQFQMSAKSDETQHIWIDVADLYQKVATMLGTGEDHELDCIFGMNEMVGWIRWSSKSI